MTENEVILTRELRHILTVFPILFLACLAVLARSK